LPAFHPREKELAREGFDLSISDCPQARDASPQSEVNASVPGAKRQVIDFGIIHII
jgi:hypothetical protein